MEQKYVVFKKEDWDRIVGSTVEVPHWTDDQVHDCFVIRFQDVLAGPGLHAYAGAAQTFLEGMAVRAMGKGRVEESLEKVRDAAFEAANIADNYPNKKVPD